ncbi:MAG: hypothetical protein ACREPE_08680 [Lysobacter sp.]
MEMDIERELIALDTCLADFKHPLSPSVRERALGVAAAIIAGASATDRFLVATRLEIVLLRHGLTDCCHTLLEAHAARKDGRPASSPYRASSHDERLAADARDPRRGRLPSASPSDRRPVPAPRPDSV